MKTYLFILFLFITSFANAQISYVARVGTPQWSSITMLVDNKDASKSQLYYTGYDSPPAKINMIRDTTIAGNKIGVISIGTLPYRYFISINKLHDMSLYNDKFQLINNYVNDSVSWNKANPNNSSFIPGITNEQLVQGFKMLMVLL